ncbi:putative uncharacterized protein DDB_G0290521 [Temnothorax curvispinosus]|uniref:Mucin-2-like n=1 Tax=Temnothorax curvispinosus TaxID=300111 RepID=A0A6J1QBU8_9HYME|nr:putative uncharacterized protein DDB_G0290521 [Temnothorax curvispinosus]
MHPKLMPVEDITWQLKEASQQLPPGSYFPFRVHLEDWFTIEKHTTIRAFYKNNQIYTVLLFPLITPPLYEIMSVIEFPVLTRKNILTSVRVDNKIIAVDKERVNYMLLDEDYLAKCTSTNLQAFVDTERCSPQGLRLYLLGRALTIYGKESTDTLPRKGFRGRRDPARRATPYPVETNALPSPTTAPAPEIKALPCSSRAPAPETKALPPLTTASAPTPVSVTKTKNRILITKVETLPPGKRILQTKSKTKWRFTLISKWGHTDPATLKSVEIKSPSIPSPTPVLPSPTPAITPVPEATTRDPILTSKVETFLPWKLVPISTPAPKDIPAFEIQARDSIPIFRIETFLP